MWEDLAQCVWHYDLGRDSWTVQDRRKRDGSKQASKKQAAFVPLYLYVLDCGCDTPSYTCHCIFAAMTGCNLGLQINLYLLCVAFGQVVLSQQ